VGRDGAIGGTANRRAGIEPMMNGRSKCLAAQVEAMFAKLVNPVFPIGQARILESQ